MANIILRNTDVLSAKSFRETLNSNGSNQLYLFFGRETEWDDENTPDIPNNSITDEFTTRDNIIAIKHIPYANTAFIIPKYTWAANTTFAKYDEDDTELFTGNAGKQKMFYTVNSSNNVYKCIDNNSDGESIIEPSGTATGNIETGDGYIWKFMYNIPTNMLTTFNLYEWIPVPYGDQKSAYQTAVEDAATYSSGSPSGGHGSNACNEFGANRLLIVQNLNQDEDGSLPTDVSYRQFGLWVNPLLISTGEQAENSIYTMSDSNLDIDTTSGEILYIENRKVTQRSDDQIESFKILLSF